MDIIGGYDDSDFLATAGRLLAEARALGAQFHQDGSWSVAAGRPPLPAALSDRLRVHRAAIAALQEES
jgi:hypothetical protein